MSPPKTFLHRIPRFCYDNNLSVEQKIKRLNSLSLKVWFLSWSEGKTFKRSLGNKERLEQGQTTESEEVKPVTLNTEKYGSKSENVSPGMSKSPVMTGPAVLSTRIKSDLSTVHTESQSTLPRVHGLVSLVADVDDNVATTTTLSSKVRLRNISPLEWELHEKHARLVKKNRRKQMAAEAKPNSKKRLWEEKVAHKERIKILTFLAICFFVFHLLWGWFS